MSRRSRRRGNTGGAGWLGKAALALILLSLLAAGIVYGVVRSYLHSDGFRRLLSDKVSRAAKVSGEFTPFRWDGLAVNTSAFRATGGDLVRELQVEGLHTEVGLGGLRRGVWEIRGSRVQRLEVFLDARDQGRSVAMPVPKTERRTAPGKKAKDRWLPKEVELQGLEVGEVVVSALLKQGRASVTGMRIHAEPTSGNQAYRVEIADGDIVLPFDPVPVIHLDRASLRYQDGRVFLNSATASGWREGHLEASGEGDSATGSYAIEGKVSGVTCDELFSETWAKRFIGEVESDFRFDNHGGSPVARGHLNIRNGTLTALPVLEALAAYADTRRFRVLALSEAHTDWRWEKGEILFSDLVLASEGLVRLEGSLVLRGRALDGSFRLGIAPGTLAGIPGAETDVFISGERGLMWAPLRITGTLDDPEEDLTERLVEAAGVRMFDVMPETGEKVIKYSRTLLGESPTKVIDRGTKIIEKGTGILEEAGGVLDGFLGSGRRQKPDKKKEEP